LPGNNPSVEAMARVSHLVPSRQEEGDAGEKTAFEEPKEESHGE
jgi:hypothetical protein